MNDENDINTLNSLFARKTKLLNLKKREIARNRKQITNKSQEKDKILSSSDSTNSIIDNSYSDTEFEIENVSKFLTPTVANLTSENSTSEYGGKKLSSINLSKKITVISDKIIKKTSFKIPECQSTPNPRASKLSEDIETTINKNIKHPALKEFEEKITVELLEKLSSSEDNISAASNDQSIFFDLRDVTDIEVVDNHAIDSLNENDGSTTFEKSIGAGSKDINTPVENVELTSETNEKKSCSDYVNAPAINAKPTPEKKEGTSCSGYMNAFDEDVEPTPETMEEQSWIVDVNASAKDSEPTPEKKEGTSCSGYMNAFDEDVEPAPETMQEQSWIVDVNASAEDAAITPEKKKETNCTDIHNAPAEHAESTPETKIEINCTVNRNAPADDVGSMLETEEDICNKQVNVPVEDAYSTSETVACPEKRDLIMCNANAASKFTKSCIDFMLPEDVGDYSDGSSDLWSPKDFDSDDLIDEEKQRKKKKLKKQRQKKNKDKTTETPLSIKKHKRENKIKKRKELKEKGLTYETSSGKIKEPRKMKENPCKEDKCLKKCFEIPEERRQCLFNYFWSLNDQQKKEFIVHCSRRKAIKRKKTDAVISRRSQTYEYYINEGEGKRQVCQKFLLHSLDISQTYLLYNAAKTQEGISQQDQRRRNAVNKYDEPTKKYAKDYIETLPVLPSHYNRKNSTRLYLPQEFKNLSNLYRLYKKHCENNEKDNILSERLFTNLFRSEYNIAFHIPKKDKCKFCTKYENIEDKTFNDIEEYKIHKDEKEATYKRCEIHRNLLSKTVLTASFDLQKVLNTPHGDSMILYYSRKYTVYNLTVYESRTQNGYCYTWGEADGKRGSAEIGTCLHKYLEKVDSRGIKYLILYCDSCSGQNKNKVILSVLRNFLETSINLEVIQINYLLPGHTYMPVDSMHSVIEREVRKIIVWSPTQWPTFMQTARKTPHPYEVNVLDHTDFIHWLIKANEIFTPETLSNKDFKIKEIRVATFKKQNLDIMEVKYTMKEDGKSYEIPLKLAEKRKQIRSKGKGVGKGKSNRNVSQIETFDAMSTKLYPTRLPISQLKYKDLKKLCEDGTIPKIYHKDYLTLPYDSQVIDTVSDNEEETVEVTQEDENIPDNKRKRKNTEELKQKPETTPKKQKKITPQKLDKDYEEVRQKGIKNLKKLKENKEIIHERLKKNVPKIIDIDDEKGKRVPEQVRKGRGKGTGRGRGKGRDK